MSNLPRDETQADVVKTTLTPADLAQAIAQAHPEWIGQALDARLLGQVLREVFSMLRKQVDAVDVGTVAVPSFGRFHARRAAKSAHTRRVLFQTPQWALPGTVDSAESAPDAELEQPSGAAAAVAESAKAAIKPETKHEAGTKVASKKALKSASKGAKSSIRKP